MLSRLIQLTLLLALSLAYSTGFAFKSTLHIYINNQSQQPYSLIIYGSGNSYEIINAFDTLPPQKTGTVQIDYQLKESDKKSPIYHILLLNSEKDRCTVEYTAHPVHPLERRLFHTKKFDTQLKSYKGPCKAWKKDRDSLYITLLNKPN